MPHAPLLRLQRLVLPSHISPVYRLAQSSSVSLFRQYLYLPARSNRAESPTSSRTQSVHAHTAAPPPTPPPLPHENHSSATAHRADRVMNVRNILLISMKPVVTLPSTVIQLRLKQIADASVFAIKPSYVTASPSIVSGMFFAASQSCRTYRSIHPQRQIQHPMQRPVHHADASRPSIPCTTRHRLKCGINPTASPPERSSPFVVNWLALYGVRVSKSRQASFRTRMTVCSFTVHISIITAPFIIHPRHRKSVSSKIRVQLRPRRRRPQQCRHTQSPESWPSARDIPPSAQTNPRI